MNCAIAIFLHRSGRITSGSRRNGVKIGSVATGTTYTDKGLKTGTRYSYYVVAYDPSGNLSPASPTVSGAPK